MSKRFAEILAAYNVQIHQLTPNTIPQVLKFLWACHSFTGINDVDTSSVTSRSTEVVTVDDEEK
jgi:hypothetical protein